MTNHEKVIAQLKADPLAVDQVVDGIDNLSQLISKTVYGHMHIGVSKLHDKMEEGFENLWQSILKTEILACEETGITDEEHEERWLRRQQLDLFTKT